LSRFKITSTKDASEHGLKMMLIGSSGVGKTTMCGTLPGKTLFLNAENGIKVLEHLDIDVINVKTPFLAKTPEEEKLMASNPYMSYFNLIEVFKALKAGELIYDNVVLDSLTEIGEDLFKAVDRDPSIDKGFGGIYTAYREKMVELVKAFRDLSGINVVFTLLPELVEVNGIQKWTPSLSHKKTQMTIMALFDEAIFIESDMSGKRHLRTTESATHMCKSRSKIEDGTDNLDLSVLYPSLQKIKKGNTK